MDITGAEVIIRFLEANGFKHVFGVPGRRILPLYDAAFRSDSIEMVVTQHEQGGSYMAQCYSQLTGKGCCVGISGPGAMNLLNGTAAAYTDSIPMLVVCGQAKTDDYGKYAIQESTGLGRTPNQLALFRAVTKFSAVVSRIDDLLATMQHAYIQMNDGRKGPVYLEIPTNLLHETIEVQESDFAPIDVSAVVAEEHRGVPNNRDLATVEEMIKVASYPLLLLGNGVVLSSADVAAMRLVEQLRIPVATTLLAKGVVSEAHDLSLGCIGIWGQKAANRYILKHCDLLLAIGTTFQELSTLSWRALENKRIVRVDIDEHEIENNCKPDLGIVGDARHFLESLAGYCSRRSLDPMPTELESFVSTLKREVGYYETTDLSDYRKVSTSDTLKSYDVLIKLGLLKSDDDIMVFDVGETCYFSEFLIKTHSHRTYLTNAGLGSMGFSVAGAVGARFASNGRNVISVTGDGGFLMNCNELATAAKYRQKVIWCVFNNGILGTQRHYQRDFYNQRYIGSDIPAVDFEQLARSFGVNACTVTTIIDFEECFRRALADERPSLLNIVVDSDVKPIPPFAF